jgi:predicted NUDIX family phosphoesterase
VSKNESVLCFESRILNELCPGGRPQGFTHDLSLIPLIFNRKTKFSFIPRSQCEDDPSYKQVITYSIVQYGRTRDDMLVFSYTRGKSGGEQRLVQLRSLGIGGHVNESALSNRKSRDSFTGGRHADSPELDYIKAEALREINEEISYKSNNPLFYLCGIINDDSNDVGKVHFGLVYRLMLSSPDVCPNEDCVSEGEMTTIRDLYNNVEDYESWSQHIIKSMKFY